MSAYTMELELCDEQGMVGNMPHPKFGGSHLDFHNHLAGMTADAQGRTEWQPESAAFACTGSAHLIGERIKCTSPAHGDLGG